MKILKHLAGGGRATVFFGNKSIHLTSAVRALVRKGLCLQGAKSTDIYITQTGIAAAEQSLELDQKKAGSNSGVNL